MDLEEEQSLNNDSYISNKYFKSKLLFIMGVVNAENELKMKRMIFRVSRGTAIANFSDINQSAESLLNVNNNNGKKTFKISKKIFII